MKIRRRINAALLLALLVSTALCWFVPEREVSRPNWNFVPEAQMVDSAAYSSFSPNANFPDGLTLRTPPAGTIARGHLPLRYKPTLEDALRAGLELQNPFARDDAARRERGGVVYTNYCQVCHGPLGQGNGPVTQGGGFPPPASLLADRAVQMKDGQLFHVLTYGQGNMPPFRAQLSRDDRWSAILHIRMLQEPYGPERGSARFQEVAKLFQENCAACHSADGTGSNVRKILPVIPDFTSLAWQMSQTELAIVNQITYGSQPMMPGFRYKLPQEQIPALAVYVRSFAARNPAGPGVAAAPSRMTASSLYGTFCYACHDTTGKGNATVRTSMPELPDFTVETWQKSRTDTELSHSILEGKGKFMLPMKDKLGNVDTKDMVALVRGFQGGKQVIPLEPPKQIGTLLVDQAAGPVLGASTLGLMSAPLGKGLFASAYAVYSAKGNTPAVTADGGHQAVAVTDDSAARVRIGATIFQQYCMVCHGPDGTGSLMRPSMPPIPNFTSPTFHQEHSNAQIKVSILDGKGTLMPANRGRVTEEQAGDLVAYIRSFGGATFALKPPVTDEKFAEEYKKLMDQMNRYEQEMQKIHGKQ